MADLINNKVIDWLDERYHIREDWDRQVNQVVPQHATSWFYCLGGLTFLMFSIQVITGVLLLFYYKASTKEAYESIKYIQLVIPFGWLVRSIHAWCSTLFLVFLFAHMIRVYFTGHYKHPRELTWVSGVLLLGCALILGFTGYLLPWDQLAYWATTVGSQLVEAVPPAPLGRLLLLILRGGESVGSDTLTRFFAFHVAIIPPIAIGLILAHFSMIRRQGIGGPL